MTAPSPGGLFLSPFHQPPWRDSVQKSLHFALRFQPEGAIESQDIGQKTTHGNIKRNCVQVV